MQERFTRLFATPLNLYAAGSPVLIAAGALLKDNQTGSVLAQLKFTNLGEKTIKALFVSVDAFDVTDSALKGVEKFQFLDLSASTNATFGQKTPIPLPDGTTRSFAPSVRTVLFADGTSWTCEKGFMPLPAQPSIMNAFGDLAETYSRQMHGNALLAPQPYQDLWLCTCGTANKASHQLCAACGADKEPLFAWADVEKLLAEKATYEQEQAEQERQHAEAEAEQARLQATRNKKNKKIAAIVLPCIAAVIIFLIVLFTVILPSMRYNKALSLYEAGEYDQAVNAYAACGAYAVNDDIVAYWREKNANTIATGSFHTVGLKADGTVAAVGYNEYGQCNVSGWTDIVAIAAGDYHTVGLKADGTVVATQNTGNYDYGQCDVSGWTGIMAIATGDWHTVGLKADGTVVAVGINWAGQCDVSEWTDIVTIAAGYHHTVGLKADGTVVAVGENDDGQCNVSGWTDIVAIVARYYQTVGLKADGTVAAVGYNKYGQCDVSDWKDIVAIAAGDYQTVGLKADGTVVAVGDNWAGQCNVSKWRNILVYGH